MRVWEAKGLKSRVGRGRQASSPVTVGSLGNRGRDSLVKKVGRGGSGGDQDKRKGHCCLFESREENAWLYEGRSPSGRSGLERGSPGITLSPAPQDSEGKGAKAGASGSSQHEPLEAPAPATVCLRPPACCLSSLRSRSSRSKVATGSGSDSTGSTAGHTADTGYSWAEGRSGQSGVVVGYRGQDCRGHSFHSCRQVAVEVEVVGLCSPGCILLGCRAAGCNSAVEGCSCSL